MNMRRFAGKYSNKLIEQQIKQFNVNKQGGFLDFSEVFEVTASTCESPIVEAASACNVDESES